MKKEENNNGSATRDIGFGTKTFGQGSQRFINKDGTFNVQRRGKGGLKNYEVYHKLIAMSWPKFVTLISIYYLLVNTIFAFTYYFIGVDKCLTNADMSTPRSEFFDAFFFSAQSLTTVGYGRLAPIGVLSSSISAIESMVGLLGFALATGLLYGRFSRPEAKILYSKNAVIAPYRGGRGFMIRLANQRSNQLIEAETDLVVSMKIMKDGVETRNYVGLPLELKKINFLALSWTIVHPIDEKSPLYNLSEEEFRKSDAEFIIYLKAFDDTFSQTIYSRTSYKAEEVIFGAKYISIIGGTEGGPTLDLDRIDETEKAELPAINLR